MRTDFEKLILQESPDAVVVLSFDGKILHWTKGAEKVFGYTAEEALNRSLQEMLIPADRHEEEARHFQLTLAEERYSYESIRRKKDGSLVYVDISSKAVCDDRGEPGFTLTIQAFTQLDSTPTKRFEGTGLGLHLRQKLADLIGGTLKLQSRHGEGSAFTLRLPENAE